MERAEPHPRLYLWREGKENVLVSHLTRDHLPEAPPQEDNELARLGPEEMPPVAKPAESHQ